MKKALYPISVLLAGVLWGFSGLFVRTLTAGGLQTFEVVFLRLTVTAVSAVIFFLIFRRDAFKIELKNLWCVLGCGLMGLLGVSLCYFTTIDMSSLSTACILMYTAPIFVTVASCIFFKEKATLKKVICLAITFAGCVLCSYEKGGTSFSIPVLLVGLGSGICYASYSIFSRFAINRGVETPTILLYTFIFSALGSFAFLPYEHFFTAVAYGNVNVLATIGISVISTALAYLFYTLGLKGVENGKAAILSCVEIVAAAVVGIIAFKEYPDLLQTFGIIMVISAVTAMNLNKKEKEEKMTKREIGEALFKEGYNCAQSVVLAFQEELKLDKDMLAKTASGFGGGFGRLREVCGAVSGMVFVLSNLEGYSSPEATTEKMEVYKKVQTLMNEFKEQNGSYICADLLDDNKPVSPVPDKRTDEYYKKRPCVNLVGDACEILEKYFNNK